MLFSQYFYVAASLLAVTAGAMPNADTAANAVARSAVPAVEVPEYFELDKRKGCSGDRKESDVCGGKKLRKQNSFHNCKNQDGKCCAENSNGTGGIDVSLGGGSEDCSYYFSGKCKG